MIPVERVVVEIGQHALCVVDEVDVSLGCVLLCAVFGGGFFILRNFDVGQPVFGRDFGMFRFCRFLARTGTLLGDGDGGRFCAAENGDDGFSGSWLDIFRKRGGNGVLPALPKVGERVIQVSPLPGDSTEACHSPVVSKLTVCFSPLSAAIVADNASWGIRMACSSSVLLSVQLPPPTLIPEGLRLLIAFSYDKKVC